MNIVQEQIDTLNAVLKVQVKPEDYTSKVNDAVKKYSKKVNMPGFRPGMVPVNLVRKMYGKSLLADELNKIVSDSIDQYINEQKLQLLGNPLPQSSNDIDMNWENPGDFEFAFEMGLAPEVQLTLPPSKVFTTYEIQVDDAQIEEEISKVRRRYGNYVSPEVTDADTSVYALFEELDGNGEKVEGGISNSAFLLLSKVKDAGIQAELMNRKVNDVLTFNPYHALGNREEVKYLLGMKEGEGDAPEDKMFSVTIERINKVEPAELTTELFERLYGEGVVTDEEGFRNKIREEIAEGYRYESDHAVKHELEDTLLSATSLVLPDEFLKRWLKFSNEKITDEQLATEYSQYSRDLKWHLIENKIFRDQNMDITPEEMDQYARTFIVDQYVRYGQAHLLTDDKLKELTERYLSSRESAQRVIEALTSRKVFEYLNQIIQKDVKKVTHDEFVSIMSAHQHHH